MARERTALRDGSRREEKFELSLARAAAAPSARIVVLVYAALAAAALYPLFTVAIPPLVDYVNHLARFHVLAGIEADPALKASYEVRWAPLPNLALDAIAPALLKLLPTYDAGRVIVAACMLLLVGGTAAVHHAVFGRIGLWPVAAFLFVFNLVLAWGFLNYLISVGLALFAIAAWVGLRARTCWLRLAVFAAVATALFFAHLLACAAYGVFVAAYEAQRAFEMRRASFRDLLRAGVPAAGQFAIPFVLWLMAPTGEGETFTDYGTWEDKVTALFSPVIFSDTLLERVAIILIGAGIIRGLFRGYLAVAPGFSWPLIALTGLAMATPNALFSVAKVDLRLPVLIVLLLVGVSQLRLSQPRYVAIIAAAGLVLFAARVVTMADSWQRYDRLFAEFRSAAELIEPGARVLSVQDRPDRQRHRQEPYFWHVATIATIERSAFSPTFFADPAKQPLRVKPPLAHLHAPDNEPISVEQLVAAADPMTSADLAARKYRYGYRAYFAFWPERFDYVVVMHFARPVENPVPRHLTRIAQGSYFDLYRVAK